jgi:hypothetical protein
MDDISPYATWQPCVNNGRVAARDVGLSARRTPESISIRPELLAEARKIERRVAKDESYQVHHLFNLIDSHSQIAELQAERRHIERMICGSVEWHLVVREQLIPHRTKGGHRRWRPQFVVSCPKRGHQFRELKAPLLFLASFARLDKGDYVSVVSGRGCYFPNCEALAQFGAEPLVAERLDQSRQTSRPTVAVVRDLRNL